MSFGRHRVVMLVDIDGVLALWDEDQPALEHWPTDSWQRANLQDLHRQLHGEFWWSTAMIAKLREVTRLPGVEARWCTTWLEHAPSIFGYLSGLGDDWVWEPGVSTRPDQDQSWWKAERVRAALERGQRVVWIDDEIDERLREVQQQASDEDHSWMTGPNLLKVCPSSARGLAPADLNAIRAFLEAGA